MKVIFIYFLIIILKHCQANETVINSDACKAERLKVLIRNPNPKYENGF